MKNNKFKFIVAIACFVLCFLVFINGAKAEETIENEEVVTEEVTEEVTQEPTQEPTLEPTPTQEPTNQPTDEPVVDEVVDTPVDETVTEEELSVRDMIKAFLDEWLIAILATLGGFAGTTGVLVIGRKVIDTIIEKLEKSLNANEEGNKNLKVAQENLITGLKQIDNKIEQFEETCSEKLEKFQETYGEKIEGTLETVKECIDEINDLRTDNAKFKELIALLVTSTPQLASNGYATKILELLNEGSESDE